MTKQETTRANEDYLEAIYLFEVDHPGEPMKSTLLAQEMNVSRAAINKAMNDLKEKGLIDKNDYGKITLTEKGRQIALKILHKHKILKELLISFGVDEEVAAKECCLIEHVVSDDTVEKIANFLKSK